MSNSQGKASDWTNGDGLVVGFGPREPANARGGHHSTDGVVMTVQQEIAWNDLPLGGINEGGPPLIPANSVILDGYIFVTTAFLNTTGLTIGLQQIDGTEIDNDGLMTTKAAAALTDELKVAFAGALVGTSIGAAGGYIVATDAGSASTAGKATLVLNYMVPGRV